MIRGVSPGDPPVRIFVLALALLPAAAVAQDKNPIRPHFVGKPGCADNADHQWARAGKKPVTMRKLNEEPVADQYLSVLRLEDGCDKPVKIRESIGDDAGDQR
jgi:hypothetical protein